ncbi:MAG: glutamate mutase L, partial [Deltaproteobacteria bacterium]|nr:glutamate mutase L [Deltaproteobacteria bacterium]
MLVAGVVRRFSAKSAERAALGAGAIVADVIACDDERPQHEQIDRVRRLRPDMVLIAGGVDGGAVVGVVELAELLAAADPRPRFGRGFRLPVIFAGNRDVVPEVERVLAGRADLHVVENLRPVIDGEQLGPAREKVHELFLGHVMQQAPGFGKLLGWTDAPVMPTPSAVGEILRAAARRRGISMLCVDIGGATTAIFSVVDDQFNRTVSANLGVSYSAAFVLEEAGLKNVSRWLPFEVDPGRLRDQVMNKTVRPTTIPDTLRELHVEQALAREALRLSFRQHRAFATAVGGDLEDKSFDEAFSGAEVDASLVRPAELDLIIGSGGVLSHAPLPAQTIAMMIDAFEPEGITRLAKDSIFMMPHLGVLSSVLPAAAESVFEQDCLIDLGTCVAPVGVAKPGRPCLSFSLERSGEILRGELVCGEIEAITVALGEEARLVVEPSRGFDVGNGPGKSLTARVRGGLCGIVIDCRGRPIVWPAASAGRVEAMRRWLEAFGILDGKQEI